MKLSFSNGEQNTRKYAYGSQNIESFAWDSPLSGFTPQKRDPTRLKHYVVLKDEGQFYGAQGSLNVWGLPSVGPKQSSSFRLLLASGLDGPLNTHNVIGAGWHVFPEIHGDHDTHLMAYWSADGFQSTGCYNLLCKGFVAYNWSKHRLGVKITPLSTYDGDQYEFTLRIFKDKTTGNWVLNGGEDGADPIGHWPKSLFTNDLAEVASVIQCGGLVSYHANESTPPMGSGHFGSEGDKKAAYVENILIISQSGKYEVPDLGIIQDESDCYNASPKTSRYNTIYIGGPGGCTD